MKIGTDVSIRSKSTKLDDRSITPVGLLNLLVVYIFWGSTYLAIRVAVREGAGIPPFTLGLVRLLLAGVLLLAWSVLRGKRVRLSRQEVLVLGGSGLLLWTAGNGMVVWAEQRVDSLLTALLVASVPMWTAVMESLLDRRLPSLRLAISLVVGFAGTALLTLPTLRNGVRSDVISIGVILLASASWTAGTVLQSRRPVKLTPLVSAAYQQIFGGLGFLVLVLLVREPKPTPTTEAWIAWGYLVVFGSIVAFSSYVRVLRLLPTSIAMTYAYVNPVIAVILGATLLGEAVTSTTIVGAALVLLGVAGVFRSRNAKMPTH